MKKLLLALVLCGNILAYDTIDEAVRKGSSNGDLSLFGHYVFFDNKQGGKNPNHLIGSLGLKYKSGYYKLIRFVASFRAAKPFLGGGDSFWRDEFAPNNATTIKNFTNNSYRTNSAMLGESFVEYFDGDTNIKAGRVSVQSEWANREIDGVYLRNKSLKNILLELMWVKNHGYVQYYKMAGMYNVNPFNSLGSMHMGITQDLFGVGYIKGFGIVTPSVFNAVGISGEIAYSKTSNIGIRGNATMSFEERNGVRDVNSKNASHMGLEGFVGYKNIVNWSLGYMKSDNQNGIGSLNTIGNSINPFLLWGGAPYLNERNAQTLFTKLNAKIDVITFWLTYGSTAYYNMGMLDNKKLRQNELNVALEFVFTGHTKAIVSVINTHGKGSSNINYPKGMKAYAGFQLTF